MDVFLIAAMTLDGYIGRSATDRSFDWTTSEDKAEYIAKIKQAKHLVFGSTTLKVIQRFPKETVCYVYTRNPERFSDVGLSRAATYLPTSESPADLVQRLTAAGVEQLAICGGASIYQQFLAAGVVNKLYLTIEPIMFGSGIRLFQELPTGFELRLIAQRVLNQHGSVWLEYEIVRSIQPSQRTSTSDSQKEEALYAA